MLQDPFKLCADCQEKCIFNRESPRDMARNTNSANLLRYHGGEWIYETDQPIVGFYIICKGVVREISHLSGGNNVTLRLLKPGEMLIGDDFLQHKRWHNTTAKSLTKTTTLFLDRSLFDKLSKSANESISNEVVKNLQSLRNNIELLSCSVKKRTAYWLLKLNECMSSHFILTNDDLADIVGCSSVTISKTLGRLENKGIIYKTRKKLNIKDISKLREHANCSTQY